MNRVVISFHLSHKGPSRSLAVKIGEGYLDFWTSGEYTATWNRFTPFNIHMEATMVHVYIEGLEERLRRRLCSPRKTSSSWSCASKSDP